MSSRGPGGEPLYRVNRRFRCPICGKASWCGFGPHYVVCMRVPSDRPTRNGGWIHVLDRAGQEAAETEIRRRKEDPSPPQPVDRNTTPVLVSLSESLLEHYDQKDYRTRQDYAAIWHDFMEYLGSRGLVEHPADITPRHVREYLEHRRQAGDSEERIARRLSVISELHDRLPVEARRFRGRLRDALLGIPRPAGPEEAVRQYVDARTRRLRDYSPSTRQQYGKTWRRFARWFLESGQAAGRDPVATLRRLAGNPKAAEAVIEAYIQHRLSQGLHARVAASERSAVRALMEGVLKQRQQEVAKGGVGTR